MHRVRVLQGQLHTTHGDEHQERPVSPGVQSEASRRNVANPHSFTNTMARQNNNGCDHNQEPLNNTSGLSSVSSGCALPGGGGI